MTNKIKLYLDDWRTPVDTDWVVARDYDEFVALIKEHGLHNFTVISLDHDLGDEAMREYFNNVESNYKLDYKNINEKTGLDCCKFLVDDSLDRNVPLPQIYVHSANPIGSENMLGYINNYLKNQKLPQSCVRININHTVPDTPPEWLLEARKKNLENNK